MAYKKSLDFLPSVFQTKTNEKILKATVDQLISEPEIKRLDGYVGRKFNPSLNQFDNYIAEEWPDRDNYQLEPSSVYTNKEGDIKFVSTYVDLINKIKSAGGNTTNPSRLFSADQYTYSSFFDFDKFTNYSNYYWLPNGPDSVDIVNTAIDYNLDITVTPPTNYSVVTGSVDSEGFDGSSFDTSTGSVKRLGETGYTFSHTGTTSNPTLRLARGGTYKFNVNQEGHGFFIQTEPGLRTSYSWQENLDIRTVDGVVNNGEDVGTVTFNVPESNNQDFFTTMPIQTRSVNLVAYSYKQQRHLRYNEIQSQNATQFIRDHNGIDGQRSIDGKLIIFLATRSQNQTVVAWTANTTYKEDDLVSYSNVVYRVKKDFTSNVGFSDSNLIVYDYENHWIDPDTNDTLTDNEKLSWFRISVDINDKIQLEPVTESLLNQQILIGEGIKYGNRKVYRNSNNDILVIPPITANLDYLYYQDSLDPEINGLIEIIDQNNDPEINVDYILTKSNYTSPNGVEFENGLKVKFVGKTIPAEYEDKQYYVEGVGSKIQLIPVTAFETPESWLDVVDEPFDSSAYDAIEFDGNANSPKNKQYIVINRGSNEGSAWTRQNRWFHESVINKTNKLNNYSPTLSQESKAKRPIIEFDKNLQLYNFGSTYKQDVTIIDTVETDALSNVQGLPVSVTGQVVSSYYTDGIPLTNGHTVIFSNDTNETVRTTIYKIKWINVKSDSNIGEYVFTGDGSTTRFNLGFYAESTQLSITVNGVPVPNSTYRYSIDGTDVVFNTAIPAGEFIIATYRFSQQIHLEPIGTISAGDVILSKIGLTKQGTNWYYNGTKWIKTQQKTSDNQEPLFDLYDINGSSLGNTNVYYSSSFNGCKLFGYKKSNSSAIDSELGFSLTYRSINNVGDIVFCDFINTDSFVYETENESATTKKTLGSTVKRNHHHHHGSVEYINQWTKKLEKSKQYQLETIFATDSQRNRFIISAIPESLNPSHIVVYKNNSAVARNDYDIEIERKIGKIVFVNDLVSGDKIDIKIFQKNPTSNNIWEIPSNLENNAKNIDISDITLGQMRNHITETFIKTPDLIGNYQGSNNSKDLPNVKEHGGTILQNAGAPHLANLFLNDVQANFIESLLYSQREYETFKNKFYRMLGEVMFTDINDASKCLDELLIEMFANKNEMFPYFYSDMCPAGNDYNEIKYEINNTEINSYYLSQAFNNNQPSNKAVLIFLNGTQLLNNVDYIINNSIVELKIVTDERESLTNPIQLALGDILTVREYNNTNGVHIPPTPSKLGLYPLFSPKIIVDGYTGNTQNVIRGHDGSKIAMFDDFRDNIILELEKRIFNNIKVKYNNKLIDINSYIPGAFRETPYNKTEFDNVLSQNFSRWLGKNNIKIDDTVEIDTNDKFSWNYRLFDESVTGGKMPAAYWRGIYNYFYDTEQPNLRPWEMLGFSSEPAWWTEVYGPAPYTSGNKVLWNDLAQGKVAEPKNTRINPIYKRTGLLDIIPVDDSGNLLSPYECLTVNNSNVINGSWKFGDSNPVETAWRHSSEYPFAVQLALALTIPAEYFGLYRDTNDQVYEGNQWKFSSTGTRNKLEKVHGETNADGTIIRVNGYTTWISEYAHSLNYNISNSVGDKLRNIQLRLSYKAAGYTDKKYLKLFAEQSSPDSVNSSVMIPDDDYDVKLFKSSPRESVVYSGVIVTRSANGFTVNGYDLNNPVFTVNVASINSETQIIKVGNKAVEVAKSGSNRNVLVPYGTEFATVENVVEFLMGLGRYYENVGFKFNDKVVGSNEVHNWKLSAKEFIFWTQQNWDQGISISLSPIGSTLNFRSIRGAVDGISNKPYGSRIYDNNKNIIEPNNYIVNRDGRNFSIEITNGKAIYLADFDIVDWEHVIVLKNKTQFNDIIYQPESGNRQYRIRISGFKTGAWDGTFGAPGFIINDKNVPQWQEGKNYSKGDIILYKGEYYTAKSSHPASKTFVNENWLETEYKDIGELLPNLANKAGLPKSYYDFNETNLELDPDRLAKGLIGFSRRDYLNDLGISDSSQVKFYQGLIRQKGSNNSLNKMLRARLDNFQSQAEFFEQWAVKTGGYGANGNTTEIRMNLPAAENTAKSPLIVEVIDINDTPKKGRISYKPNDLLTYTVPFNKNSFSTRDRKERVNDLPSAGYAQNKEVKYISPTLDELNNFIDNRLGNNDYIWIGSDNNSQWNIYKTIINEARFSSVQVDPTGTAYLTATKNHGLSTGDDILIKVYMGNDPEEIDFSGFYKVLSVDGNIVQIQTDVVNYSRGIEDDEIFNAVLFNLHSVHFNTVQEANNNIPSTGWQDNDKLYIDQATTNGWGVYQNSHAFKFDQSFTDTESSSNDGLGHSVASDSRNNYILVGTENANKIQTFKKNSTTGEITEDADLGNPSDGVIDFGNVLEAGSNIYAASGSPLSNSNRGYAHVLKRNSFGSFIIDQALAAPNHDAGGRFGSDIAISDDGLWMYIGQPGVSQVHAYQFIKLDKEGLFAINEGTVGDGSTTTFILANAPDSIYELKVIVNNKLMIPFKDYTVGGATLTFTTAPAIDASISIILNNYFKHVQTITGTALTDFGHRVVTSTDGRQVIISATNSTAGTVHVYDKTVENFYGDGNLTEFTTSLGILGSPRVLIDNEPIQKYESVFDGIDTITVNTAVPRGSIISIETNNFVSSTSVTAGDEAQSGAQYGYSIDLCPYNCSLYVGAPYHDVNGIDTGRVYRYLNQGKFYGVVVGSVENPIISGSTNVYFNNFRVSFSAAETLTDVVTKINNAKIPGVTALSVGNILTIETNSEIFADKLNIVQETGSFLTDMGIDIYVSREIINSPNDKPYNNFGKVIKVDNSANMIAIAADQMDTEILETFDNDTTSFDYKSTRFSITKKQSGGVLVYQYLAGPEVSVDNPGSFVYSQKLVTDKLDSLDQFGTSIEFTNNTIIVGAPGSDDTNAEGGVVYQFKNTSGKLPWSLMRYEKPQVDIAKFNRVFIYDSQTNQKVTNLDVLDPIKGKVTSDVLQEISYQTSHDPAFYSDTENLGNALTWGEDFVNKVWWDLGQVRYVEYNHDGEEYSSVNWGYTFPGSRIICAEWTESNVPPNEYSDPNNPDSYPYIPTKFNTITYFDQNTQQFTTKYYFWVVGKTRAPKNVDNRIYSTFEIEDLIANPTLNGIPYIAFTSPNTFILYNISDILTDTTVLAIDYDIKQNNNILHQEYQLINEGDVTSVATDDTITKLIDSLAGADRAGNSVPDIKLNNYLKFGLNFRPRQTLFEDKKEAIKQAVVYFNNFMKTTPVVYSKNITNLIATEPEPRLHEYNEVVDNYVQLSYINAALESPGFLVLVKNDETTKGRWVLYELQNDRTWTKKRIQVYNNNRYIKRVTWTDPTVKVPNNFDNVVEFEYNVRSVVASDGDFVKVKNNGLGKFKVLQKQGTTWKTVQEEESTIEIQSSIYETELLKLNFDQDGFGLQLYDDNPSIEIQNIFRAIYDDFFVNEHAIEKNQWFIYMLKYAMSKNKTLDVATKTSLIKVNQSQRNLQQVGVYQKDNQDFIRHYIEETKPYHTKISEFVLQYNSTDNADLNTTDFDLPAYYSFNSNTYRSPNGSTIEDNNLLLLAPWVDWTNNYKLEVGSVLIHNGGTYLTKPNLTITGGGGTGAKAEAIVINNTISSIIVTNPGSGYTSQPTITIDQPSSNPAKLSAVLINKKIRSFDTTVKFDRISHNSGYLIEFKNSSGEAVDLSNETIFARNDTRSAGAASVFDLVLNIFSSNWINDTDGFPALDVPNFRFYNDSDKSSDCTSVIRSKVQFFDSRDTDRGLHQTTLQSAIRALGTNAGINNIDVSGTTVTLDGSLIDSAPSVLDWKNNFVYYTGEIVHYNGVFYTVDIDYTSASTGFSDTNLTILNTGNVVSHLDRTWKLYSPTDGMLANDPKQLYTGTVFPGARVIGVGFNDSPGFDISRFDMSGFDPSELTVEGVPTTVPSTYDQSIYSRFTDTALGTRPEDIITSGGKFLDPYHSYAPEEHVPGSVYDTLEMFVHTLPMQLTANSGYSPEFKVKNYLGDGTTTRFAFDQEDIGDYFLIYTTNTGARYRKIAETNNDIPTFTVGGGYYGTSQERAYSVDWQTGEIVFDDPIDAGDVLSITRIAQIGKGILSSKTFTGDGSTKVFALGIDRTRVKNQLVLVNGKEVPYSISGATNTTFIAIDSTPNNGDHVHIVLSGNTSNTISKVYTQLEQLEAAQTTIALDQPIRNTLTKDTTVIAEYNSERLRPSNTAYYYGNGSRINYELPNTAQESTMTSINISQVRVWVDDVKLQTFVDYEITTLPDGSTIPAITLFEPAADGARVSVTYTGDADYTINESNNTIELLTVTPNAGDLLAVTSFSDHDSYQFETRVFVGTDQFISSSTTPTGFDEIGFDFTGFDAVISIVELNIEYGLGERQLAERLFVSVDGVKMVANHDYIVAGGNVVFKDSITIIDTSVVVITEMNKNIHNYETTYSIFNDMNGNVSYYRIAEEESTVLAQALSLTDTEIVLKDASEFPTPVAKTPGVISINGERITYFTKNGNTLGQIRRGVAGTGATDHPSGAVVLNMNLLVPDSKCKTWYTPGTGTASDGRGLQGATTTAAEFIRDKKGLAFPHLTINASGIYVDEDYMDEGYLEDVPSGYTYMEEDYMDPDYVEDTPSSLSFMEENYIDPGYVDDP